MADKPLTWEILVDIVPELGQMMREIRSIDGSAPTFCANEIWYELFKDRLQQLVGWDANNRNPRVCSSEAYDLAYHMLYKALPPCQECSCL